MNVTLTPELEQIVERQVKSGRFSTAGEVVRESLFLLDREDEIREIRKERLLKEISKGVEQIERGEYTEISSKEQWVAFLDDVKARGRKRLGEARSESK